MFPWDKVPKRTPEQEAASRRRSEKYQDRLRLPVAVEPLPVGGYIARRGGLAGVGPSEQAAKDSLFLKEVIEATTPEGAPSSAE